LDTLRTSIRDSYNPNHLFVGTYADNMQDSVKKGRIANGSQTAKAKLNRKMVEKMRSSYANGNVSLSFLARKNGVAKSTVWDVMSRRTWKHLERGEGDERLGL